MTRTKAIIALAAALTLTACGLTAPRSNPGFANLSSPGVWDTDREFSMTLGPTLLHFAANFVDDDPETKALLRGLDGIRIRVYEIDGDSSRVAAKMDLMQSDLSDDGWDSVMLVREEDERTHLMLKSDGSQVFGLTMLSTDGYSQAVVINLIGDIQPEMFSDVMVALDIDDGAAQDVVVHGSGEDEPIEASVTAEVL